MTERVRPRFCANWVRQRLPNASIIRLFFALCLAAQVSSALAGEPVSLPCNGTSTSSEVCRDPLVLKQLKKLATAYASIIVDNRFSESERSSIREQTSIWAANFLTVCKENVGCAMNAAKSRIKLFDWTGNVQTPAHINVPSAESIERSIEQQVVGQRYATDTDYVGTGIRIGVDGVLTNCEFVVDGLARLQVVEHERKVLRRESCTSRSGDQTRPC